MRINEGGVFGSTIVDKSFQHFLKTRLGEDTIGGLTNSEKDMMMDAFVEQKERFVDAVYEDNIVSFPRAGGFFLRSEEHTSELQSPA